MQLSDLSNFIGTEHWYKHWIGGFLYTDGVKYLADEAGAHWLIDLVASYQPKWKSKEHFQLWRIEVRADKSAVVTMRKDSNTKPLIKQSMGYTDFPFDSYEWYCIDGVMLLKGEY